MRENVYQVRNVRTGARYVSRSTGTIPTQLGVVAEPVQPPIAYRCAFYEANTPNPL
jgi:hypothetical protein